MPEHLSTATDRRARLDPYIIELSCLAKERCPKAVVEVRFTQYEDEDAHLVVFLPESEMEMTNYTVEMGKTRFSVKMTMILFLEEMTQTR